MPGALYSQEFSALWNLPLMIWAVEVYFYDDGENIWRDVWDGSIVVRIEVRMKMWRLGMRCKWWIGYILRCCQNILGS